jgi:hypothetical protein
LLRARGRVRVPGRRPYLEGRDRLALYIPKGTLHAHRNVGEGLGRMLVPHTPRGLYELFFEKVGKKAVDGEAGPLVVKEQPDVGRIVEVAAEYGIEIPPPIAE